MIRKICPKCGRSLEEHNFFSYRNNREKKYPICKNCIKMNIDDYNPDTFIKYIKEFDDPWSPTLWNKILKKEEIRKKEQKGIYKYLTNTSSIIGKYLAYVRLKGFQGFSWESSDQFEKGQSRLLHLSTLSSKEEA